MPQLDLDGQSLAYREQGHGAPPLLLLHGAGGSSAHYQDLLGHLGRERRAVALDLPGHGRSLALACPPPPEELLEAYRDAAAGLAERLGLGRFVLAGHSMGGAVALNFALSYPERLAGLVLLATGARLKVAPMVLEAIRHHFDELPGLMSGVAYSPASDRARVAVWAGQQVQAPREVMLADFEACACFDRRERLGEVSCPTLVISAADDRLTPPRLQEQLAGGIPGARLETVSRAGHFLLLERPEAVARAILDFA